MAKHVQLPDDYTVQIDVEEIFNAAYIPFITTIHRFEVYFGGSSAGKSVFIGQKLALQMSFLPRRNLVCLRMQGSDARDSVYPVIHSALEQFGLLDMWEVVEHPNPRLTNRINGNVIIFTGLDSAENIKSMTFKHGQVLTDIWYEEATEEMDMNKIKELVRRLRGGTSKKRLILSFNPIFATHPIKKYIEVDLKGKDALILKTTYRDNKFLEPAAIAELEDYRMTDPYAYQVYALGNWGTTGQSIFPATLVYNRIQDIMNSGMMWSRIEFQYERDPFGNIITSTFSPFECANGMITIFKLPNPRHPYAAAADTAEGGGDYFALPIIDNITQEQVAVLWTKEGGQVCVPQMYGLLRMYNDALFAPETNFDTYTLSTLQQLGYTRFYQAKSPADSYNEDYEQKLGFRTTSANRKAMLSFLVAWVHQHVNLINDVELLQEMLTFTQQVKKSRGLFWAAEPGAHDDLIMAFAILLQIREQQSMEEEAEYTSLQGMWLPEELDMFVASGLMERGTAQEYQEHHKSDYGNIHNSKKGRVKTHANY